MHLLKGKLNRYFKINTSEQNSNLSDMDFNSTVAGFTMDNTTDRHIFTTAIYEADDKTILDASLSVPTTFAPKTVSAFSSEETFTTQMATHTYPSSHPEFAVVNGSGFSINYKTLLADENRKFAKALIPVTIYLVFLMIIGVVGNLLVLYVYKFRFKRSTSRVFILSLAAFDFLTCILGMPFHIIDMVYPFMFIWDEACKSLSFAITFTILASIFVLDLIAIDRYRKICFPFGKQLSAKGTKITCWVVVVISLILAVPMLFIYGVAESETGLPNVTGSECYIAADMMESDIPLIYNGVNIMIFVISVMVLSGLYIKVAIVVRKRKAFQDSRRDDSKRSTTSGTSSHDTMVIQMNTLGDDAKHSDGRASPINNSNSSVHHFGSKSSIVKSVSMDSACSSPRIKRKNKDDLHKKHLKRLMSELSTYSGGEATLERTPGQGSKFANKKQMRTLRITGMLFTITMIFVISFLPYLIIEVLSGTDEEFWDGRSRVEIVLLHLLMRTYFINNMINPLVYWFLDKKFKQEVRKLFRDAKACKWSRTFKLDKKSITS